MDDREPKYGLSVTGIVHPDRIIRNHGIRPNDALILTKPIGTGVLFNGLRAGKLTFNELSLLLPSIAALNKTAIETALDFDISSCTDITGFGLIGHLVEMLDKSSLDITINYKDIPIYPCAGQLYKRGIDTGANKANREMSTGVLQILRDIKSYEAELLFDPQTSGGLLISVADTRAVALKNALISSGIASASIIGHASASDRGGIRVV